MKEIASALVRAQKAFGPALKTSTNPHFRSRYVDLSACVEAVITGLNDNGIALIQQTHDCDSGVCVETLFLHESGESLSAGKLHVPASKQDAQGYGSALTYARRYSLMAACGIAPEDDDGNAASRTHIKAKVDAPMAPKVTKEDIKAKVDANWWTPEVETELSPIADKVNAFLVGRDQIQEGQTWKDIKDDTYRSNIVSGLARFIKAVNSK